MKTKNTFSCSAVAVGSNGELNYGELVDEQILTGMIHTSEAWWNELVLACMSQVECKKPGSVFWQTFH